MKVECKGWGTWGITSGLPDTLQYLTMEKASLMTVQKSCVVRSHQLNFYTKNILALGLFPKYLLLLLFEITWPTLRALHSTLFWGGQSNNPTLVPQPSPPLLPVLRFHPFTIQALCACDLSSVLQPLCYNHVLCNEN